MVMLMLLTKTLLLNDEKVCLGDHMIPCFTILVSLLQFGHHIRTYYKHLCNMITLDLRLEIRTLLQKIFTRIGTEFHIVMQ